MEFSVLYDSGWDGNSWIGGRRVNGIFRWEGNLNGDIQLAYWSLGEPNNVVGDEHCVESPSGQSYFWNDHECLKSNYFICESQY